MFYLIATISVAAIIFLAAIFFPLMRCLNGLIWMSEKTNAEIICTFKEQDKLCGHMKVKTGGETGEKCALPAGKCDYQELQNEDENENKNTN